MTVKEIIGNFLQRSSYDGLFNVDSGCACLADDLFPCNEVSPGCEPGYRVDCTTACKNSEHGFVEGGWHIQETPYEEVQVIEEEP